MSRRTRIWIASVTLLAVICAAPVIYLRVSAIPACEAADRLWRSTDAPAKGDWSGPVRRATLDYLVAPIDGRHRFLTFQRAHRPNESDVDLVFMPSGVADALIVYRYNWHLGAWYCKVRVFTEG
jgi:hypothetical protein